MPETAPTAYTPEKQTVLITGASGFLGKYAVNEFSAHNYTVQATGRNQHALDALQGPGIELYPSSLEGLATLETQTDTVVHAAARSDLWGTWQEFYDSNVAGTESVVKFCELNGVKRLVYVSSPSIYSEARDRFNISEDDFNSNNTLNHYIKSKIMAEQLLQNALAEQRLQELVIIRPRGLIGVGDPSMMPRILEANRSIGIPLFKNGENTVDLTCVENVALALRLAAEAPKANGDVYNITNGEPHTFKSLVDELYKGIGETPHYRHMNVKVMYQLASVLEKLYVLSHKGEPPLTRYTVDTLGYSQTLDISKATSELGYAPIKTLHQGIADYALDYRAHHG